MTKTVFFGTPDFAVPTLEALSSSGLAPALVVSQPDRPAGRGRRLTAPPVARWAREHGLPVAQPDSVRAPAFLEQLEALAPDVAVVVAFGQIFRRPLLELPPLGCINLHGSLLPRWRGAAPIQAAIAHGDRQTGVTTMQMEAGLDTGPILLMEAVDIGPDECAPELSARLASIGGPLMVETIRGLASGTVRPREQDHTKATVAGRLNKTDGDVDWQRSARQIYDTWRAFAPWPGLRAHVDGQPLKLLGVRPSEDRARPEPTDVAAIREPGALIGPDSDGVAVVCGDGSLLRLERVQRPGRRPVAAIDWYRGERLQPGHRFDGPSAPTESEPTR